MGMAFLLVVAEVVIPAYIVLLFVSIWLAIQIGGKNTNKLTSGKRDIYLIFGFLSSPAIVIGGAWLLPELGGNGLTRLHCQIGVVMLGPIALGLTLAALGATQGLKHLDLTSSAIGAIWATPLTPFVALFFALFKHG